MAKTKYTVSWEITDFQYDIMVFIDHWVRKMNTPVPRREVMKQMIKKGSNKTKISNSLNILVSRGYIRHAITISNKTSYVQQKAI